MPHPIFGRTYKYSFPRIVVLLLAAGGFAIGMMRHSIWQAILLMLMGSLLGVRGWWVVMTTGLLGFVGALVMGLTGYSWILGAFLGAVVGFLGGLFVPEPETFKRPGSA